jgi:hypothetical protein
VDGIAVADADQAGEMGGIAVEVAGGLWDLGALKGIVAMGAGFGIHHVSRIGL